MTADFWQGRRVFLTGHTGFKGSWMSLWLQHLGAELTGYALAPPTTPSLFDKASVASGMKSVIGDIRDLDALTNAMSKCRPEVVIHMAAQPLVRYSYSNPIETYSTNVMGSVNLLEAVRFTSGVRAVVNVTTDKCYENREWVWGYRENEPMGGYDPYSNSKACSELITSSYRLSYFNPAKYSEHNVAVASARAGNVIGGGDWAKDRLIPDILTAFQKEKPVVIRDPGAIRPWQHVLEPLRGYLVLAERLYSSGGEFSEGWNFGPSDEDVRSVGWIVQRMSELWGEGAQWVLDVSEQPHEAGHLKLDISKARNRLKWTPKLTLDDALNYVVDWVIQCERDKCDVRDITLRQIDKYTRVIKG